MSLKKQYLKSRPACKVALRVPKAAAQDVKTVHVVGDFNEWQVDATPMKALKNGDFTCTVELSTEQDQYEFRYLLDNGQWENDWAADAYIPNGMGTENSVICLAD
uniref:1,4-alpha-glucan branching enzyme (EC) n=1 Tax=uncultured Thiotrichaceae bacterium TaxID=298394 RepID=A0A6S6TWL9_9GAMM|nr:MAG: 1,4-alpha-glucan branching enzyme (EC [uncultured Thiotrichaceae bacterium]